MYKYVLLVSDCSKESLVALRERALITQALSAQAHLLIVTPDDQVALMAQAGWVQPAESPGYQLLELGLTRMRGLGVKASGKVLMGNPVSVISNAVRRLGTDLIVIGHRRPTFIERWWSRPSGAYLVDGVTCSVLIARATISDAAFEQHMKHGI